MQKSITIAKLQYIIQEQHILSDKHMSQGGLQNVYFSSNKSKHVWQFNPLTSTVAIMGTAIKHPG